MNLEFHLYSKLYCAKGAKIESIMKFIQLYAAKKSLSSKGQYFLIMWRRKKEQHIKSNLEQ